MWDKTVAQVVFTGRQGGREEEDDGNGKRARNRNRGNGENGESQVCALRANA